jgi:hypothetical protein
MTVQKTRMFGKTTYKWFGSYNEPSEAFKTATHLRRMYPLKVKVDPTGLDHYGLHTGEKSVIWVSKDTREKTIKRVERATKPQLDKRVKELFR